MAEQIAQATAPQAKQGLFSGRRGRALREALTAYAFLTPAAVIIFTFGLFPVAFAMYISLYKWRVIKTKYLGFGNYLRALGQPADIGFFLLGVALFLVAWLIWRSITETSSPLGMLGKVVGAVFFMVAGWVSVTGLGRMVANGDARLFKSLLVTVFYATGTVPIQLALSLLLAIMLYQNIRGRSAFRVIFFIPYITPTVASAGVFTALFTRRSTGFVNRLVGLVGIPPQKWLSGAEGINQILAQSFGLHLPAWAAGPCMALVSIIIYNIWVFVGYDTVIFLAGLGGIPKELYEAAEIDGAGRWGLFRHITLPLLSPTTFFLSIISVIGVFKAFNHIYVLRTPGARGCVDTASIYIFDQFYKSTRFGYASTLAFVLFIVILTLTYAQNRIAGRRVFYG